MIENLTNEVLLIGNLREGLDQARCAFAEWGIGVRIVDLRQVMDLLRLHTFLTILFFIAEMDLGSVYGIIDALREATNSPIAVFSIAQPDQEAMGRMIALGADLCIPHPVGIEAIAANAFALARRFTTLNKSPELPKRIFHSAGIHLSADQRKVYVMGREVKLRKMEFDLLCMLMEHSGRVFQYEQIYRSVWGEEYGDSAKSVLWQQVARLRAKLQYSAELPQYIRTVKGVGYSFDPFFGTDK